MPNCDHFVGVNNNRLTKPIFTNRCRYFLDRLGAPLPSVLGVIFGSDDGPDFDVHALLLTANALEELFGGCALRWPCEPVLPSLIRDSDAIVRRHGCSNSS